VRGTIGIPVRDTTDLADARRWWAKAQLEAAHAYALKIDADWMPGQPFVERVWDVDEAWAALLGHVRAYGGSVTEEADRVRVVHRGQETIYRFDPQTWADYLNGIGEDPLESAADDDLAIVPAALPSVDGLPLWAVDDLNETTDTRGPIIGIVEGKLVGLDSVC